MKYILAIIIVICIYPAHAEDVRKVIYNIEDEIEICDEDCMPEEVLFLRIDVVGRNTTHKYGKKIELKARLCSRIDEGATVIPMMVPQDYFLRVVITEESGGRVRYIGPELRGIIPEEIRLGRGECFSSVINIVKNFDIRKAGVYTIQAHYFDNLLWPMYSITRLSSNIVKIRIK